jgi:isopentenyl-diphosphate delta-isomerase
MRAGDTSPKDELVVLLDEQGQAIGTAPKATVHSSATPLHRAFSCYLFDHTGRFLLTRRGHGKTFAGMWTNSVCGHPGLGENDHEAIRRRARQELGIDVSHLKVALPSFRYKAESDGVVENEICPVYLGRTSMNPHPDSHEVAEYLWIDWPVLLTDLSGAPDKFSPWFRLQTEQLEDLRAIPAFLNLLTRS